MEYNLKNKVQVTKEFLSDLTTKGWQEIDHLQNQIANIEDENSYVIPLLKNLLTSYYVFVGGLENLDDAPVNIKVAQFTDKVCADKELTTVATAEPQVNLNNKEEPVELDSQAVTNPDLIEPFEYFVDFDEPTGEPLTDDDIYN
jgi:hypothetical protein